MSDRSLLSPFVRLFYKLFYNRFAFTYDIVSEIVSRGEWRAWTRAAIPFVGQSDPTAPRDRTRWRGSGVTMGSGYTARVLEIAFGTGNLLLDLADAGYAPVGIDLSPYMIEITQRKLSERRLSLPILRAAAQQLPFPTAYFDSIVMTFPAKFVTDRIAMKEFQRVLADDGSLIWVDAPHLYPRSAWSRFLNWAYRLAGGPIEENANEMHDWKMRPNCAQLAPSFPDKFLPPDGWSWRVHRVERELGFVHVIIGAKGL